MKYKIYPIMLILGFSIQVYATNDCLSKATKSFTLDLNQHVSSNHDGCEVGNYKLTISNFNSNNSYIVTETRSYLEISHLTDPNNIAKPYTKSKKMTKQSTPFYSQHYNFNLGYSEHIKYEIEKINTGAKNDKWIFEIITNAKGKWVASWSIAILNNHNKNYYSKKNDSETFIVTQKLSNNDFLLVPTVFYTYAKNSKRNNNSQFGPTFGLGLDKNNLTPFVGYNWTWNQNIGISAGAAINKQSVLLGEFRENQITNDNITTLTEDVYKANLFIALSYRF